MKDEILKCYCEVELKEYFLDLAAVEGASESFVVRRALLEYRHKHEPGKKTRLSHSKKQA